MERPKRWSGRHKKWVFASKVHWCPLCNERHGGVGPADVGYEEGGPYDRKKGPVKGTRVCEAHMLHEFKHLPKKEWPSWAQECFRRERRKRS
jgi:hypothetical protein